MIGPSARPGNLLQAVPETLPEPPLPGGVADVVRWFMHVPQAIQIGGAVLAAAVAIGLAVLLWRRRRAVAAWLGTRPGAVKAGLAAAVAILLIVAASFGVVAYDYVQHDNDFCTTCHVMGPAYEKFVDSEHADLLCHDCHQQPISASMRQLYLWVLDRPEEIGPHAPVPNRICAQCHIRDDPTDSWERIAATAGHRVHLESEEEALADVMCVTCHGQEVHQFIPADVTCGQSGCHAPAETRIVLGEMTEATGLHCVTCHEFTAVVAEDIPADAAAGVLRPAASQCFSCHDMAALLAEFDAARDPHEGLCGSCHDPHTQETPEAAFASCTAGGCHDQPAEESPFHRGISETVLSDCGRCHEAHDWTVEGTACVDCHPEVADAVRTPRSRRLRAEGQAAAPALLAGPPAPRHASLGPEVRSASAAQEARPFRHRDHRQVECTACHSSERRHGEVVIGAADCFSCHHSAANLEAGCQGCHAPEGPPARRTAVRELQLGVWSAARTRRLPFDHADHREVACMDCHRPPTMAAARECAECHQEHHRPTADCAACHAEPAGDAHTAAVHLEGCGGAGCHAPMAGIEYGALERTRDFCLSCHQDQRDHEPGERCVRCHLLPGDRSSARVEAGEVG